MTPEQQRALQSIAAYIGSNPPRPKRVIRVDMMSAEATNIPSTMVATDSKWHELRSLGYIDENGYVL